MTENIHELPMRAPLARKHSWQTSKPEFLLMHITHNLGHLIYDTLPRSTSTTRVCHMDIEVESCVRARHQVYSTLCMDSYVRGTLNLQKRVED